MLIPKNVHPSWDKFITTENLVNEVKVIERKIGSNFNPIDSDKILRFLSIDINKVKVAWLGQDVYPAKGVATGRAFEVGGLNSWLDSFRQASLQNIVRLIHKNHFGIEDYKDIKAFRAVRKEIEKGIFTIQPPNKLFDSLEEQGVLFINTSFTCEIGKAKTHKVIWKEFSKGVLKYISERNPDLIWFLWGKEAISTKKYIQKGIFFESRHPRVCSEKYPNDFLKFNGFEETRSIINWLG
ncbi:uracil-DNA glycosylase [Bacillus cereus]|uniref:uracil-DNA glycosylase n=1 Tax=Bacillus cereus TaxID=1396 RepID=UPI002B24A513|nr:uracil-DNA glycosylase [Bacillus cereus]MEB2584709.1 uracil-DNA glycosylase [Bacillus cereus]MEB2612187.1 uracil-DNA glycosylase [Bacillus cereus]